MIKIVALLHKQLLSDLEDIMRLELPESQQIEHCFRCCMKTWDLVKAQIKMSGFNDDEEEIYFFKYEKSKFTGLIEYYTQLYHAILFAPWQIKEDLVLFWNKEQKKIDNFFSVHKAFSKYYEDNCTHYDRYWFLRANCIRSNPDKLRVYDLDPDTTTSHDWILTMSIAYKMYIQYLQGKMAKQ